jgi:hypothetical protein
MQIIQKNKMASDKCIYRQMTFNKYLGLKKILLYISDNASSVFVPGLGVGFYGGLEQ